MEKRFMGMALSLAAASALATAPAAFAVEGGAGVIGEACVSVTGATEETPLPHADAVPG